LSPEQPKSESANAWAPLRQPLFRALWTGAVVSNIGTWMQNVGVAWLMTSLAPTPLMVALVQTAATLPVFFVALPAGALADVVDRRRLLLLTQGWMLAAAGILGVLTLAGLTTPQTLLWLTFMLGLGDAMNNPAWGAIVPEIVPRSDLSSALSLNSVGYNLARAVGPALGGLVVATAGAGSAFLFNAASFLAVMFVLFRWRRAPMQTTLPAEQILGAVRSGLRYVRNSPPVKAVLVRSFVFIFSASALWALLPLVALQQLGQGSIGYGGLLTCLGLGAVFGAFFLPGLRAKLAVDVFTAAATVVFGLAMFALPSLPYKPLLYAAMMLAGGAWLTVLVSMNVAVQNSTPVWVRARALAVYILVFQGGFALGSLFWGWVAKFSGIPTTLQAAGIVLCAGIIITNRFPLSSAEGLDLRPAARMAELEALDHPAPEQGPVMVTIEYRVDPESGVEFAEAMRAVRQIRVRDGAIQWGLFHDLADSGRFLETFVVESWAEHLRQHDRVTADDRAILTSAQSFHVGEAPPRVSHLIYSYPRGGEL